MTCFVQIFTSACPNHLTTFLSKILILRMITKVSSRDADPRTNQYRLNLSGRFISARCYERSFQVCTGREGRLGEVRGGGREGRGGEGRVRGGLGEVKGR